uniref:Uncharacterized protein n=1 Tax=Mycena chlorophos TaxID=658473 RepID=A0ABQ0LRM2_MYCCL|nr:predicted protein [Mycena chlorophos]
MSSGCPAIDRKTKTRCGQPIRRREWCYGHWKAQKNHYDSYKYDSDAYARFDNTTVCTDYDLIAACGDSSQLARWARELRIKQNLCRRAIDSRRYHHNRFFGGGDDAHLRFINELCEERTFMDSVFDAIARRYDELSAANLPTEPDRDSEEVEAVMQYHHDTPTSARAELLERLFSFRKFERLHKDDPERWTRFVDFMERIIIQTLRRRAGIRPLLDCLGAAPDLTLHAFLADESVITFEELQQVYVAVHLVHPRYVLRSISDAFRSTEDPHIFILGRRIFEEPTPNPCLDAWDMFEDFMPARKWAIHAAPTLSAWIEVDRIVALGLRFPSWQPPHLDVDAGPTPASIVFPLCRTFIQYEWERASGQISRKSKKEWIEEDRRAALYLKFSKSAPGGPLFFQRVVSILQAHPQFFGVLPIASGHFKLDSPLLVEATRVIPSTPNVLSAGQRRQANGKGKLKDAEWVDLPYFDRRDFGEKFTGRGPFALSDPAGVLHLLVTDCMDVGEDQLRDHVAAILLAEGLVAIAAGTIHVTGDSFRRFRARLTQILERHADADLVRRWSEKKLQRKRKDAIRCWERHKSKLERIACLRHFFFLGTTEGHDELKKRLGREISRIEGEDQPYDEDLYDHVTDSALSRAREAEKMMPPREEPADWDNEPSYCEPEEIISEFEFMKEGKFFLDPLSAQIVELDL